jgi:outer membrane protein OmpA-like peptidoglycan-associated protein
MYGDDGRRWAERLGTIAVVAVIAGGAFVTVRAGGGHATPVPIAAQPVSAAAPADVESTTASPSTTAPDATSSTTSTAAPAPAAVPETTTTTATTSTPATPSTPAVADPPAEPADVAPATVPTVDHATSESASTSYGSLGYPAAPDGSPLPIIATYDVGTVTLTGHVPSEAAHDRLVALAAANSQDDAEVIDRLVVNEHVPPNVGVRVIEMNSPRFPEGEATISAEHAAQLDRVAAILHALPNVSVLVVGHADQRGNADTNLALSDERARAVVDYLVYLGVEPTRIASRAAGESDLLTLDDDETALALNRRTEFVFSGILLDSSGS